MFSCISGKPSLVVADLRHHSAKEDLQSQTVTESLHTIHLLTGLAIDSDRATSENVIFNGSFQNLQVWIILVLLIDHLVLQMLMKALIELKDSVQIGLILLYR